MGFQGSREINKRFKSGKVNQRKMDNKKKIRIVKDGMGWRITKYDLMDARSEFWTASSKAVGDLPSLRASLTSSLPTRFLRLHPFSCQRESDGDCSLFLEYLPVTYLRPRLLFLSQPLHSRPRPIFRHVFYFLRQRNASSPIRAPYPPANPVK